MPGSHQHWKIKKRLNCYDLNTRAQSGDPLSIRHLSLPPAFDTVRAET